MKKIKKAQGGDTTSLKTSSGPRGQLKTYTTESGGKKVKGKIFKTKDWERSSRSMKNPGAGENDTLFSKRERGSGTDSTGKQRSAEMSSYAVKRPGGIEKGSSMTETKGGKTTGPVKKVFKKAQSGTSLGAKDIKLNKAKNGGSYASAAGSTGHTGEGMLTPSKKNVGKTKKQATFKSGGKMKTCKGGC